jgi:hypothetical protein
VFPVKNGFVALYKGTLDRVVIEEFLSTLKRTGEQWVFLNDAQLASEEHMKRLRSLLHGEEDE